MAEKSKSNEITLVRVYDAPVRVVWDAWTDPEQVAQWWGPRGFTLTTHSKDLRPGGHWAYTMHGPDGTDYPNKTQYLEVETCSRLVYDHGANDDRPPLFRVTVVFSETKGKTTMQMTMALPSPEAADEAKVFIKKAGGDATWDRLAEYLDKTTLEKDAFVIHRSFDVPIDVMFEMWTNPKHVAQWLPPTGFQMEFIKAEIRPGAQTFYFMWGNDIKMHGKAQYLEITKPNRLVYSQQFCDEQERVARHPFAPVWPETMLTTVTLAEEAPERTRVTVKWDLLDTVTPEERDMFTKSRGGMTQGWTGSFDKLDVHLAGLSCTTA